MRGGHCGQCVAAIKSFIVMRELPKHFLSFLAHPWAGTPAGGVQKEEAKAMNEVDVVLGRATPEPKVDAQTDPKTAQELQAPVLKKNAETEPKTEAVQYGLFRLYSRSLLPL